MLEELTWHVWVSGVIQKSVKEVQMQKSGWEHCLEKTSLTENEKKQYRVILRWFLGNCRKRRPPAQPGAGFGQ